MANQPYEQLAKDFLDLWQNQMAAVIRDKDFIRAMLEMTQTLKNTYETTGKPSASNASTAAHAGDGDLSGLAFRLAMCEQRIAALEAAAKKPAAKPRRKAGAKRSPARRGKKTRK